MKNDSLNCYGNFSAGTVRCRKCSYMESCRYYAETSNLVDSRAKLASYEQLGAWNLEAADYSSIPGESDCQDQRAGIVSMLAGFFRFLLDLDDYSLGIISEIIKPCDPELKQCTVSHLGRVHGCSRQAMHRKLLDMIAAHPELSGLLKQTMYKLPRSRQTFMRKRAVEAMVKNCNG